MPCFQVVNCTEACQQVSALGGALQYGPYSIPELGPCAMLVDPQEVAFRILEVQAPAPGGGRGD
jgi:predicted enzyme related to lactoylglutathione lyase